MNLVEASERLKSPRAAACALGIGTVLIALLLTFPIVLAFHTQSRELADSLHRLSTLEAQGAQAHALKGRMSELEHQAESLPGAVQAKNAMLAQSQIQQSVEALFTGNGATIRSAQILSPVAENGFETISIQYDLVVPTSKLRDLTYAVETHLPYLFITDASISGGQQSQSSQPQDPPLEIRWTIRAYRWGAADAS